jgi:hypothetical protein
MSTENHGVMMSTSKTPDSSTKASGNPTSSHLIANQEELGGGNREFGFMKYLCSYFEGIFNML